MSDQARVAVLDLVRLHYGKSNEPLFLSSVGQALRGQKLWPIDGEKRSLKDWLASLEPAVKVIADETSPARVAVVSAEKAEIVEERLLARRDLQLIGTLARPLLLAFCVRGSDDQPVFLTRRPPFRYTTVAPDNRDDYLAIAPQYRLPGLLLRAVTKMPANEVAALGSNIRHWADAESVALDQFTKERVELTVAAGEEVAVGTMSALDRLLQAQRPDVRNLLVVPADIAVLLSRHR